MLKKAFFLFYILIILIFSCNVTLAFKTQSVKGHTVRWADSDIPVKYVINPSGAPEGFVVAVQAAFQTWEDVSTSRISFIYLGEDKSRFASKDNPDNTNVVAWYADKWDSEWVGDKGRPALAWTDKRIAEDGHILDADIAFNGRDYKWTTSPFPCFFENDVQNVATHEIGHFLGLDDLYGEDDTEKTMYGSEPPGLLICETKKRSLHEDDIAGVSYLYLSEHITRKQKFEIAYFAYMSGELTPVMLTTDKCYIWNNGDYRLYDVNLLIALEYRRDEKIGGLDKLEIGARGEISLKGANIDVIKEKGYLTFSLMEWIEGVYVTKSVRLAIKDALIEGIYPIITITNLSGTDYAPKTVSFDTTQSLISGGLSIKSYLWDFGDGETSTEEKPIHTYNLHGEYTVTLKVVLNNDVTSEATATVTVKAAAPAPYITQSLQILPPSPYYEGDTITATFTIGNKGTAPITFKVLTVGGRGPEGEADIQDFTHRTDITLNPNESYDYQGELTITKPGKYHFFCAYQTPDGQWNTNIDLGPGLTEEDRIEDITVIEITENYNAVDVVLIIDRSGSMGGPVSTISSQQRFAVAKEAALEFATFLEPGDYVSIIDFKEVVSLRMQLQVYRPYTFKQAINNIPYPEGATNIGDALGLAYQQLAGSRSGNVNKIVVLLTDGAYNTGPNPIEVVKKSLHFIDKSWPIYTIGLGSGEEFNEKVLQEIAQLSGGQYKHASSAQELGNFYATLAAKIRGATTIVRLREFINQAQLITHPVELDPFIQKVSFILNWGGSKLDFILITPRGQKITPQSLAIEHSSGENYAIYKIDQPEAGNWTVQIQGSNVPPSGEQYLLSATVTSEIISGLLPFKPTYELGDRIQIGVELKSKDSQGRLVNIIEATPEAHIQKPDGGKDTLILSSQGEGIFSSEYTNTHLLGSYLIEVKIKGTTPQGTPFNRQIEETVVVGKIDQVLISQTSLLPKPDSLLKDAQPLIQARISGPARNINVGLIQLQIDGQVVVHSYDKINQIVTYKPEKKLAEGNHTVTLSLKESKATWSFQIDSVPPVIESIKVEGSPAKAGDRISINLRTEAQASAELTIEGVFSNLPLQEIESGLYQTFFKPAFGIDVVDAPVIISLRDAVGNESIDQSQKITIDTIVPEIKTEVVDKDKTYRSGETIHLRVITEPKAEVTADCSEIGAGKIILSETKDAPGVFESSIVISYADKDNSGPKHIYIQVVDKVGNVANDALKIYLIARPVQTTLFQNYPNPFNPETWIPYQLAEEAEVVIKIHDVTSRLVRTLELGKKPAGFYLSKDRTAYWDGKNSNGERVSSGVYFYTIQAGPFQATKKMVITK
jgi:PKD repeat protein